ncbi:hypothetical protein PGT21_022557 [Puccinia graminis f. sp. tritici]|uniref:Uncharacterized protein n=1 Tax=Puccinia graminis f. sp. tritici TaxID=56615 RepID=A0A5B0NZ19_PUCGR|nr:hypothetical protein PGT21_022557 [Puccinia graminis f. sp. tritici]
MGRQFKQNPLLLRDPVFARSSCLIATFLRLRNESEDHLFTKIVASFSSLPSLQKEHAKCCIRLSDGSEVTATCPSRVPKKLIAKIALLARLKTGLGATNITSF